MVIIWNDLCRTARECPVSCPESYFRDQIGTGPAVSWQTESFANACMVRMSELHPESRVFTTDSDFKTYRKNGRQTIPLLAPW